MDASCCICLSNSKFNRNRLLTCGNCSITVHQGCYGIKDVDTSDWFCKKCESQVRSSKIRCDLCPIKEGAFKESAGARCGWTHMLCAFYISEVYFNDVESMNGIMVDAVPSDRLNRMCMFCERSQRSSQATYGACIKCAWKPCRTYFHVTCASEVGLLSPLPSSEASSAFTMVRVLAEKYGFGRSSQQPVQPALRGSKVSIPTGDNIPFLHGYCCERHKKKCAATEFTGNTTTDSATVDCDSIETGSQSVPVDDVERAVEIAHAADPVVSSASDSAQNSTSTSNRNSTEAIDSDRAPSPVVESLSNCPTKDDCDNRAFRSKRRKATNSDPDTSVSSSVVKVCEKTHTESGSTVALVDNKNSNQSSTYLECKSINVSSSPCEPFCAVQTPTTTCISSSPLVTSPLLPVPPQVQGKEDVSSPDSKDHLASVKPIIMMNSPTDAQSPDAALNSDERSHTTLASVSSLSTIRKKKQRCNTRRNINQSAAKSPEAPSNRSNSSDTSSVASPNRSTHAFSTTTVTSPLHRELPVIYPRLPLAVRGLVLPVSSVLYGDSSANSTTPATTVTSSVGVTSESSLVDVFGGNPSQLPLSTLHDLLEWQWDQSAVLLRQQAECTDVVALLDCLHQLKSENDLLEAKLLRLQTRKQHLCAVNARLTASLATMESTVRQQSSSPSNRHHASSNQLSSTHRTVSSTNSVKSSTRGSERPIRPNTGLESLLRSKPPILMKETELDQPVSASPLLSLYPNTSTGASIRHRDDLDTANDMMARHVSNVTKSHTDQSIILPSNSLNCSATSRRHSVIPVPLCRSSHQSGTQSPPCQVTPITNVAQHHLSNTGTGKHARSSHPVDISLRSPKAKRSAPGQRESRRPSFQRLCFQSNQPIKPAESPTITTTSVLDLQTLSERLTSAIAARQSFSASRSNSVVDPVAISSKATVPSSTNFHSTTWSRSDDPTAMQYGTTLPGIRCLTNRSCNQDLIHSHRHLPSRAVSIEDSSARTGLVDAIPTTGVVLNMLTISPDTSSDVVSWSKSMKNARPPHLPNTYATTTTFLPTVSGSGHLPILPAAESHSIASKAVNTSSIPTSNYPLFTTTCSSAEAFNTSVSKVSVGSIVDAANYTNVSSTTTHALGNIDPSQTAVHNGNCLTTTQASLNLATG